MSKKTIIILLILGMVVGTIILNLGKQDQREVVPIEQPTVRQPASPQELGTPEQTEQRGANLIENRFDPADYGTINIDGLERINWEILCDTYGGKVFWNNYVADCHLVVEEDAQEMCDFIDTGSDLIPNFRETVVKENRCLVRLQQPE